MSAPTPPRLHREQAAVFADYDNLLSAIRSESTGEKYPDEYAAAILREVQRYLKRSNNLPTSITRAYADFGALDDDAPYIQRALQRDGFEPRYVPSGLQRNAPELQLALDVMDAVAQRPALSTFVIVTGDRPYLPLIRRIAEAGRHVLVVALFPPRADDTSFFAKDDVFLDARTLLSEEDRQAFPDYDRTPHEETRRLDPHEYQALTDPIVRQTVAITEEYFGQYDEVYLTPLLRKLSDVLGPEHDPKSLISRLEEAGAVRLEKRNGYPYDYTVLIVHDDHPDVQDIQDAVRHGMTNGHDAYAYDDAYDENIAHESAEYDDEAYDAVDEHEEYEATEYEATESEDDVAAPYDESAGEDHNDAALDGEAWEEETNTP